MDDTIFQLLADGFFDDLPTVVCDCCLRQIEGEYFTPEEGGNYCLPCVQAAIDADDSENNS